MAVVYRLPWVAKWLYPQAMSTVKFSEQVLCLTFDDGPDPGSTPYIMDILNRNAIKACFFCTGENAEKFPELVSMLVKEGHVSGNHTYSHLDGIRVTTKRYLDDILRAVPYTSSVIFRPPFGRMKPGQYRALAGCYKIVLWDLLAADFAENVSGKKIIEELKVKIRSGSIIALHDKPISRKKNFLEEFIKMMKDSGYTFVLPDFNM